MELKNLLKLILHELKSVIFISSVSCLIFITAFFLLPVNYIAEGTIFAYPVENSIQNSEVSNELNYARNLIALTNSPEFKKITQNTIVSGYSFTPLIGVTGGIKLKEVSPNILSLSITGNSEEEITKKYQIYLANLSDFSSKLKKGNSNFELFFFSEQPIITRNDNHIFLFVMLGLLCGTFVSSLYIYYKKK